MASNLISISDLSFDDLSEIVSLAGSFKSGSFAFPKRSLRSDKRTVMLLFLEPSTRTRFSFELALRLCGYSMTFFDVSSSSSMVKGEGFVNTVRTLSSMNLDCLIARVPSSGELLSMFRYMGGGTRIVNAGDGTNEHPTQALLDLFTILEAFAIKFSKDCLSGSKIGICGDVLHSRVTRSNIRLLTSLGARVLLITSPVFMPNGFSDYYKSIGCEVSHSLEDSIENLDVLMMLRLQRERYRSTGSTGYILSDKYSLNSSVLRKLRSDSLIMHPAPVNNLSEITNDIAYGDPRSLISRQVENGVHVRAALLWHMLSGSKT